MKKKKIQKMIVALIPVMVLGSTLNVRAEENNKNDLGIMSSCGTETPGCGSTTPDYGSTTPRDDYSGYFVDEEGIQYFLTDQKTAMFGGPCKCEPTDHINIPEKVIYNNIEYKVTEIDGMVLFGLSNITVDEKNESFSVKDGVLYNKDKTKLIKCPKNKEQVDIVDGVITIGQFSFYGCENLTNIKIPDSVINIEMYAFDVCTGLTSVTIPANVSNIGEKIFYLCYNLKNINVDEKNQFYSAENTTLFNKDKTKVISYTREQIPNYGTTTPSNWSYYTDDQNINYRLFDDKTAEVDSYGNDVLENIIIPEKIIKNNIEYKVTSLGFCAFGDATKVKNIEIPESVTGISALAFYNCTNLENINIPESVKYIEYDAFCKCDSLKNIEIPENVQLKLAAFDMCGNLENIIIDGDGTKIEAGSFILCNPSAKVQILGKVISLKESSFYASEDIWFKGGGESGTTSSDGTGTPSDAAEIPGNGTGTPGNGTGTPQGANSGDVQALPILASLIAGMTGILRVRKRKN